MVQKWKVHVMFKINKLSSFPKKPEMTFNYFYPINVSHPQF